MNLLIKDKTSNLSTIKIQRSFKVKINRLQSQRIFPDFLDNSQYKLNGILRYEKIFGRGFISTGGKTTTEKIVGNVSFCNFYNKLILKNSDELTKRRKSPFCWLWNRRRRNFDGQKLRRNSTRHRSVTQYAFCRPVSAAFLIPIKTFKQGNEQRKMRFRTK